MTDKLEPCPAECLHSEGADPPYVFRRKANLFGVCCPACGASTGYFPTVAEATAAWNTRAPQTTGEVGEADIEAAQALCSSGWTNAIAAFRNHRLASTAQAQAEIARLKARVEGLEGALAKALV